MGPDGSRGAPGSHDEVRRARGQGLQHPPRSPRTLGVIGVQEQHDGRPGAPSGQRTEAPLTGQAVSGPGLPDHRGSGVPRHADGGIVGPIVHHQDGLHSAPVQGGEERGEGAGLVPGGDEGHGGAGSGPSPWLLALLGAGMAGCLALMAHSPAARGTPVPALGLWAAAFLLYAAAGIAVGRGRWSAGRRAGAAGVPRLVGVVWVVAVAGRVALVIAEPHLSDDVWRYLWDGHVQLQGLNPYLHAPAAPELEPLRTSWHSLVNHPSVPTIYPPGAQLVFGLLAIAGSRVLVYKLAWITADLATGWILGRIARDRGLDPLPVLLLFLWCPLLLAEVAWSGHLAPLGLLSMMAAVWVSEKGGRGGASAAATRSGWMAGGALGVATAVKFAPAAGLPALVRRHGWRAAAAFTLALGLLAAPYLGAGSRIWAGLAEYLARWSFHPGPFGILEWAVGSTAAKGAAAAAVAGLALRAGREGWSLERALFWTVGAALLLTPTLHPWYLLWILPFAALRIRPGWLLFTGTAFLSYFHLDLFTRTGDWPQPVWLTLLIWVPPLAVMAWRPWRSDDDPSIPC